MGESKPVTSLRSLEEVGCENTYKLWDNWIGRKGHLRSGLVMVFNVDLHSGLRLLGVVEQVVASSR